MKKLNLKKLTVAKLNLPQLRNVKGGNTNLNCTDYCKTECMDDLCNTKHFACDSDVGGGPIGGGDTTH